MFELEEKQPVFRKSLISTKNVSPLVNYFLVALYSSTVEDTKIATVNTVIAIAMSIIVFVLQLHPCMLQLPNLYSEGSLQDLADQNDRVG